MPVQTVIVEAHDAGQRVDIFLSKKTEITRSQIRKLLEKGDILVNEGPVVQNYRVRARDIVTVNMIEKSDGRLVPEEMPLDILYEDEHLVVVNKPAGMVVYPAAGHSRGTLMNALACHCPNLADMGGPLRPGVVHRLDKDTSGVMVVALTDRAYYDLAEQFKQRTIHRRYLALVFGNLRDDTGEIASKIGRSGSDRKKMSTRSKRGKEAVTRWKVIQRFGKVTFVEVRLGTGRTHQIRVHFSSIGHPVLGDRTYGNKMSSDFKSGKRILFPRQMLHAELLGFRHPATDEYIEFSAGPPEDMSQKLGELEALVLSQES